MPRTNQEEEVKMYNRKAREQKAIALRTWLWKLAKEGKLKK